MKCIIKNCEVRGITENVSKKGNAYYTLNLEDCETGEAFKIYAGDRRPVLNKGDVLDLECHLSFAYGKTSITY